MLPRRARRAAGRPPPAARRRASAIEAGRAIRRRRPRFVRLVGHGSSDNAAVYGTYAFGLLGGVPAFRASISLSVYYGAEHELERSPVVALSQSGRTPDVVEYVERARRSGALTIAVTNEPASELADAAEIVVPLDAGPERAVAATKTYVNQLAALALLAAAVGGDEASIADDLRRTAALLVETIERLTAPQAEAARHSSSRTAVRDRARRRVRDGAGGRAEADRDVPDRGGAADDDRPVARAGRGARRALPVWAVATRDPCLPTVLEAAARVRTSGAALIAVGDAADEVEGAALRLPVPTAPSPLLAPLLSIAPASSSRCARRRARARSRPPGRPSEGHTGGLTVNVEGDPVGT